MIQQFTWHHYHQLNPWKLTYFETIARLTFSQMQNENFNNAHTQPLYSNSTLTNRNSSPQNINVNPHNQSTVILQELRNFTDKVSGDTTKITQTCSTVQQNTG